MSRPANIPMRLRHAGDGVSVAIEDHPSEAARMRDLMRGLLPEWMSATERNDAIVVVSELVTNALVHGRPPRTLHVHMAPDTIVIEVSDGSPVPAATVDPTGRVGGQGLRIVEALCERWGSSSNPDGMAGKHVWCAMRTAPEPSNWV